MQIFMPAHLGSRVGAHQAPGIGADWNDFDAAFAGRLDDAFYQPFGNAAAVVFRPDARVHNDPLAGSIHVVLALADRLVAVVGQGLPVLCLKDDADGVIQFILQGFGRATVDDSGYLFGVCLGQVNPRAAQGIKYRIIAHDAFARMRTHVWFPEYTNGIVLIGFEALLLQLFLLGHSLVIS